MGSSDAKLAGAVEVGLRFSTEMAVLVVSPVPEVAGPEPEEEPPVSAGPDGPPPPVVDEPVPEEEPAASPEAGEPAVPEVPEVDELEEDWSPLPVSPELVVPEEDLPP